MTMVCLSFFQMIWELKMLDIWHKKSYSWCASETLLSRLEGSTFKNFLPLRPKHGRPSGDTEHDGCTKNNSSKEKSPLWRGGGIIQPWKLFASRQEPIGFIRRPLFFFRRPLWKKANPWKMFEKHEKLSKKSFRRYLNHAWLFKTSLNSAISHIGKFQSGTYSSSNLRTGNSYERHFFFKRSLLGIGRVRSIIGTHTHRSKLVRKPEFRFFTYRQIPVRDLFLVESQDWK